ncbi:MAG: hypothetical protein IJF83_13920 [Methanobrevibacter sp.]|nr:hypothetical protein [Methanobrevibacter sp.]
MDKNKIILIAIVILVIALAAVAAYIYSSNNAPTDVTNKTQNKTVINIDKVNNTTVVGDNSTRPANETNLTNENTPYKVYNPQTDSYVPVIGEKYDDEVNRWYTYDEDGVRYYNTRINTA